MFTQEELRRIKGKTYVVEGEVAIRGKYKKDVLALDEDDAIDQVEDLLEVQDIKKESYDFITYNKIEKDECVEWN